MKIQIVEDEYIIARSVELDLESYGYTVCGIAADGETAIKLARQNTPAIILMDINLAGEIDGIETASRILDFLDTTIIFMTGYAGKDFEERISKVKHKAYLNKPVDIEMILPLMVDEKGDK